MRNRSIFPAIVLILVGLWFLAANMGFRLPEVFDWRRIWPGFIILGGLSELWSYYGRKSKKPERLFNGLAAIGVGCYFFLFTLMIRLPVLGRFAWGRMAEFWPGFIVVGGLAFLGQFALSGFKHRGALALGLVALLVGATAFGFTLGFLSPLLARRLADFWPLLLVIIGLGMLSGPYFRRR